MIIKNNPICLCVTNDVVMNFTANVLLSCGASPIMSSESKDDIKDLIKISSAVLLNIGTLGKDPESIFLYVVDLAIKHNIPIVFDPVGSGASKIRTDLSKKIFSISYDKMVIKGNASEIISIFNDNVSSRGVDSAHGSEEAVKFVNSPDKIICITGKDDFIIKGEKVIKVSNGSSIMQKVTGTGCALGAVLAAGLSNDFSIHNAAKIISCFGIAGEIAEQKSTGPGSFAVNFIDSLYSISDDIFEKMSSIQ